MHALSKNYHTRDILKDITKKIRKAHYDPWYQRSRYAVAINDQIGGRLPMFTKTSELFSDSDEVTDMPPYDDLENLSIDTISRSSSVSSSFSDEKKIPTVESYLPTRLASGIDTPVTESKSEELPSIDKATEHKLRLEKARQEEIENLAKEKEKAEKELESERQSRLKTEQEQKKISEELGEYKRQMWNGTWEEKNKSKHNKSQYHLVKLDTGERRNLYSNLNNLISTVKNIEGLNHYPKKTDNIKQGEVYYNKKGKYIIFKPQDVNDDTKDKSNVATLKEHLITAMRAHQNSKSAETVDKPKEEPQPDELNQFKEAVEAVNEDEQKWKNMNYEKYLKTANELEEHDKEKGKDVNYYTKALGLHLYNQENPLVAVGSDNHMLGRGSRFSDDNLMDKVKDRYIRAIHLDDYKALSAAAKRQFIIPKELKQTNSDDNVRLYNFMAESVMKSTIDNRMVNYTKTVAITSEINKDLDTGKKVVIDAPYSHNKPIATIYKLRTPSEEYESIMSRYLSRDEFDKLTSLVKKAKK
jgi:hypothetical protein